MSVTIRRYPATSISGASHQPMKRYHITRAISGTELDGWLTTIVGPPMFAVTLTCLFWTGADGCHAGAAGTAWRCPIEALALVQ